MTLTLYTNPAGLRHDTGLIHPESAARLQTLLDLFASEPFASLPHKAAAPLDPENLSPAHPQNYVRMIQDTVPEDGAAYLDADTPLSPGSWNAALEAAGAVCQAVDDVMNGATKTAFCAVRPPGHHAEESQAMGFCIFNNIVIGALHARKAHGLKKIAIVDFDVHHGNGTQNMVLAHDGMFYISSHQSPLFPGTGLVEDNVKDRILNIPMSAGTASETFRALYRRQVFPALAAYKPQLLMISAGFDAHRDDPLAQIDLGEDDYRWVTEELVKIAATACGGKIVSVLEGGYNLSALRDSVAAHLNALR